MSQVISFSDRFKEENNQAYIAIAGEKKEMIEKLEKIISDIKGYGKPIQENMTGFNIECQIITPIWNGKSY